MIVRNNIFKYIIILFLCLLLLIIPNLNYAAETEIKLGDVNNDKIINNTDLLAINRHIYAKSNNNHSEWILKNSNFTAGDVNKNGKIDSGDMLALLRYIAANTSSKIRSKHPEWLKFSNNPNYIDVSNVMIDKTSITLEIGKTEFLVATIQPTNATNKEIKWISSNEKIATVDNTGKVTAISNGTAKITAKSNNEKTATCSVIVTKSAEKVVLNKTQINLDVSLKKTETLVATIEPNTVSDKTITWSSNNEKVAKVDKTGIVTAVSNGTAQITAQTTNGKTATCIVNVRTSATDVSLIKNDISEEVGKSQYIFATIQPNSITNLSDVVEWKNSNPEVAAIEKKIENGTYYIKSALNENKVLDVANGSTANKAVIQIYDRNESDAQKFEISNVENEYYSIKSKKSGKMVDVTNGGKTPGTKVQQYTSNGTDSQKWEFEYLGDGYYHIRSKLNGLYLDVKDAKTDNKTPIQVWTENKNKAQRFKLELIEKKNTPSLNGTYYIKTKIDENKVLEIDNSSNDNKAKVQLQIKSNEPKENQQFEILSIGNGFYVIKAKHSGKAIDVYAAGNKNGTVVDQYSFNGSNAQIWKLESAGNGYYYFKSRCNGLYLDCKGGKATSGLQMQVWEGNKTDAQKFKLEKVNDDTKYANFVAALLKPKIGGNTTVTATIPNGKQAICKVKSIKKVKVTFNANGGSGGGTQTFTYGVKNQKFNVKVSRGGYTFVNWNTKSDGSGSGYTYNSEVSDSWINSNPLNVTLYAKWKGKPFNNPRFYAADPFVYKKDGYYYMAVATGSNTIDIYKNKELQNIIGGYIGTISVGSSVWAPEIYYFNGHWYIYASIAFGGEASRKVYVYESNGSNPAGPYKGAQAMNTQGWSIDGSILELNNKLYFLWCGSPNSFYDKDTSIYIAQMSNPKTISGGRVRISSPSHGWEYYDGEGINEGPRALKHNGKVFIIYSACGSWTPEYCLGMLTLNGSNPLKASAWSKKGSPVFSSGNGVYGPGRASFVKSPNGNEDWMIYHGNLNRYTPIGDSWWGERQIFMQKFTWNKDGTPHFGSPISPSTSIAAPN